MNFPDHPIPITAISIEVESLWIPVALAYLLLIACHWADWSTYSALLRQHQFGMALRRQLLYSVRVTVWSSLVAMLGLALLYWDYDQMLSALSIGMIIFAPLVAYVGWYEVHRFLDGLIEDD